MKPDFGYFLQLKDSFLSNKFIVLVWKPFAIGAAVVISIILAWALFVLIRRLKG